MPQKQLKRVVRCDTMPWSLLGRRSGRLDGDGGFDLTVNNVCADFIWENRQEGLRLYQPNTLEKNQLITELKIAWSIFDEEIRSPLHPPVIGVFMYDSAKCQKDYSVADAMCVSSAAGQGSPYFCIGFDIQALKHGPDYTQFLILHELAHALAWDCGHSPHFEALLDTMILRFNIATGRELDNDYSTFNDEEP